MWASVCMSYADWKMIIQNIHCIWNRRGHRNEGYAKEKEVDWKKNAIWSVNIFWAWVLVMPSYSYLCAHTNRCNDKILLTCLQVYQSSFHMLLVILCYTRTYKYILLLFMNIVVVWTMILMINSDNEYCSSSFLLFVEFIVLNAFLFHDKLAHLDHDCQCFFETM